MAIATAYATCRHCGEAIALRTYAAPYSPDEHARTYGVKLWTSGNGVFPGDQSMCESHILTDDIGSYGRHDPRD